MYNCDKDIGSSSLEERWTILHTVPPWTLIMMKKVVDQVGYTE